MTNQSVTLNLSTVGEGTDEVVDRLSALTAHEPVTITEIPDGDAVDVMLQMETSHLDVEEIEDALGHLVGIVAELGIRINYAFGINHDEVVDKVIITVFDETLSSVDRFTANTVTANLGDSIAGI